MKRLSPSKVVFSLALGIALLPQWSSAATPSAQQALKLTPTQPGVDYDRPSPEQAAKCKIIAKKINGHVGWIVEESRRRDLAEVRRHRRQQCRGSVELLQGRAGSLSRHRLKP